MKVHKLFQALLPAFFILLSCSLFAQKSYVIKEQVSEEVIPFVKVFPNIGEPVLANLDGEITIANNVSELKLRSSGYIDTVIKLDEIEDNILYMRLLVQDLNEVVAVAGENPAHRIIDQVIANRKKNHPQENDAFVYEAYTKFLVETDEALVKSIPDTTSDTSLLETKKFMESSHLFLIESHSERKFIPPFRDKEVVKSYRVSGLSNPLFSTIANQLQSFSFYETQVELAGNQYINPIALGGTRRYLFILEDTTLIGQDSVFHISFRPFKKSNFKGMRGMLYINSNGWAIQKVRASSAEPSETMQLEIIQEYEVTNDYKWFPKKLSSSITFPSAQISIGDTVVPLKANSHTDIVNVRFNPEDLSKRGFDNVNVEVDKGANLTSEEDWESKRTAELTEKEKNTFRVIDSIAKEEDLDRLVKIFEILASGKIPAGYVNIPLHRLMGYNVYEGFRLGLGLETSAKFSKRFVIGGYGAYGFRDKKFKYGFSAGYDLLPSRDLKIMANYHNDLHARGTEEVFDEGGLFDNNSLHRIYDNWMDREVSYSAGIHFRPKANIIVNTKARYRELQFLQGYQYEGPSITGSPIAGIDLKEVVGEVEWHLFQQYMKMNGRYVPTRINKPVVRLQVSAGQVNQPGGTFIDNYLKAHLSYTHNASIRGLGTLDYKIEAASAGLGGDAPMSVLVRPRTSLHPSYKIPVSVQYTYETMNSINYFFQDFAGVITQLKFYPFKFSEKFRPQLGIHNAIATGTRPTSNSHRFTENMQIGNDLFNDIRDIHMETGILINNLFNNLGAAVFYDYGATSNHADPMKNFVIKLTVTRPF